MPPHGAEHESGGFPLRQSLLDRAVAAHLAGGQIAQSHPDAVGCLARHGAAKANLDVVGMGTEDQQIYWHALPTFLDWRWALVID